MIPYAVQMTGKPPVGVPRPLMVWDFRMGQFTDVAFTRGSSGTYFDQNGVLQTAPTNVARFDHDPVSGAALGLLIEEQRENLCLQSEDLGTTWLNDWGGGLTLTTNDTVAPDSNTTADKLASIDGTNDGIRQPITITANTEYTVSCFWKTDDSTRSGITIYDQTGGAIEAQLQFSWSGGVPSTAFSAGASNIAYADVGAGWHRVSFTFTSDTVNTIHWVVLLPTIDTIGQAAWVWGCQLEEAAFLTSYIATTTAALTRSADVASIALSDVPGFDETNYTLFVEADHSGNTVFYGVISINDDSTTNEMYITSAPAGGDQAFLVTRTSGGNNGDILLVDGGWPANTVAKLAAAVAVDDMAFSQDGGTPGTDTTVDYPVGMTVLKLGLRGGNGQGFNGHIARLVYWPVRLSDVQLQGLTA